MTSEDDFQNQLDKTPEDNQTRLVFADFLQDRDDPRADGYRALAIQDLRPFVKDIVVIWGCCGSRMGSPIQVIEYRNRLQVDWFAAMLEVDAGTAMGMGVYYYLSRREAEDAAAMGFNRLNGIQQGIYLKKWDSSIYLQS